MSAMRFSDGMVAVVLAVSELRPHVIDET